jgi:hypothetical protein
VKPRKSARPPAALQKVPELLLDEARQSLPVAQTRGLRAKGLDLAQVADTRTNGPQQRVFAHDLVEQALRGMPRFVGRRGRAHARPAGGRRASEHAEENGLNASGRERHGCRC